MEKYFGAAKPVRILHHTSLKIIIKQISASSVNNPFSAAGNRFTSWLIGTEHHPSC